MRAHEILSELLETADASKREDLELELRSVLDQLKSKLLEASEILSPVQTPHGRFTWINE